MIKFKEFKAWGRIVDDLMREIDLEKSMNEWMAANPDVEIIDIKRTTAMSTSRDSLYIYDSTLVIYK